MSTCLSLTSEPVTWSLLTCVMMREADIRSKRSVRVSNRRYECACACFYDMKKKWVWNYCNGLCLVVAITIYPFPCKRICTAAWWCNFFPRIVLKIGYKLTRNGHFEKFATIFIQELSWGEVKLTRNVHFESHPDMTSAVDLALKANYLYIILRSSLQLPSKNCHEERG